jgi:pimeloyl-ACP methyl ester carboxylesterase
MYPGNGTQITIVGQPTIFVGYSWGGDQAYQEAANAGWDISHLILIDPVAHFESELVITKPWNVGNMSILYSADPGGYGPSRLLAGSPDITTITVPNSTHKNVDSLALSYILSIFNIP